MPIIGPRPVERWSDIILGIAILVVSMLSYPCMKVTESGKFQPWCIPMHILSWKIVSNSGGLAHRDTGKFPGGTQSDGPFL